MKASGLTRLIAGGYFGSHAELAELKLPERIVDQKPRDEEEEDRDQAGFPVDRG